MKKRFVSILSLLLLAVFVFCSCSQKTGLEAATTTQKTERSVETTATTETDPVTTASPDPFASVRGSGEEWIRYGLAAYDAGKEIPDMSSFFSGISNDPLSTISYVCLYDDLFLYDPENAVPVAEAFFDFVVRHYGVDALQDFGKRWEYRSAYLRAIGVGFDYASDPETYSELQAMDPVFAGMTCTSNETYKYVLSFDNATYYFKDFPIGYWPYHGTLYYKIVSLNKMIAYLNENALSEWLETGRHFHYYMTLDSGSASRTLHNKTRDMYINDFHHMLHETIHAMGITDDRNVWLCEGISNYFGYLLGFDELDSAPYISNLIAAAAGYYDQNAAAGDPNAMRAKRTYEDYVAHGGAFEPLETKDSLRSADLPLYFDAAARAEFEVPASTLGDAYKEVNNGECTGVGADLTYNQATSLVQYLADTYGIVRVLNAYKTQDIEGNLGKDYAGLKAEWLEYLQQ